MSRYCKLKSIHIINLLIILIAVSPAFALGDGNRNLLLIGAMGVSPYFLFRYPIVIPKVDFYLGSICLLMISFPLLFHPETMRWSTVLYSCLFCLYFMAFARVLYSNDYKFADFLGLLKGLIYAYCIVLIIQQFCVLTGFPIFNLSNYDIKEPWKLNSLMSEPSHSARIIPVFMYIYITAKLNMGNNYSLKDSFRDDCWVWFAFFWSMLTMVSSTAFIFMTIVFAKFINIRRFISSLIIIVAIGAFLFFASENKSVSRVRKVVVATMTLNEKAIIKADHSASFRIVPSIQGAKLIGLTTLNDWVGYGVDADQKLISPLPTVKVGNAGSFYMWVNYGFLVALLFWTFSFRVCLIKKEWASILVWFLCIFMYGGLNNQIIWLVLMLLYTYKSLLKNGTDTSMD